MLGSRGFQIIGTLVITMLLAVAYADEIVNFTLNKSRPENPWLFPLQKNEPKTDKQVTDEVKQNQSIVSQIAGGITKNCRENPIIGLFSNLLCTALATFKTSCTKNTDCANPISYCEQSTQLCSKAVCASLVESGSPKFKADVVFVGNGYASDEEFENNALQIVDWSGTKKGFMSVEPFRSNRTRFNIWAIRGHDIPSEAGNSPERARINQFARECPARDYVVVLSADRDFVSHGSVQGGTDAYLSLINDFEWDWGLLFLHEFGHTFGRLADEYVNASKGDHPRKPNCAPDNETAKTWWAGIPNLSYEAGCSYVDSNVRPTYNSIMRNHWEATEYGEVNKQALEGKLNDFKQ